MPRILVSFDANQRIEITNSAVLDLLRQQPAWTRLEPQSLSGNPAAGIEARMHDPLWLIARQWQMGEFRGEDCGTPVSVQLRAETRPLTGLRHGDPLLGNVPVAMLAGEIFEPEVEAEPWSPPSLRARAEAAAALCAALGPLGWAGEALLQMSCPFDPDAPDIHASKPDAAWQMVMRNLPDGEAAALALEAGTPDWIAGESAVVLAAAADWLNWYRENVSRRHHTGDSWFAKRLEYRFGLQAGGDGNAKRLEAPCHLGGPIEWYSVDMKEGSGLGVAGSVDVGIHQTHIHATKLRYPGMPSNRMWEFEDGLVNFGVTEVQPNDLARLAFLEYATIYGNDWLVAPIDLPRGVLAEITSVSYRTTFNEIVEVAPAVDQRRRGRFEFYALSRDNNLRANAFVIPPNSRAAIEGAAIEEVIFARDETANVVWAIERSVQGADGLARDRTRNVGAPSPPQPPQPGADLRWTLEEVPAENWVPMVPIPTSNQGGFILRKGSFDGTDNTQGTVLAPTPFDVFDEEVPREGVLLRRIPAVIRDETGQLRRWIARRVSPAWGGAKSTLAYDETSR